MWCAFLSLTFGQVFAGPPDESILLNAQFDIAVKDCRDQIETGKVDACITALRGIADKVAGAETDAQLELKQKVGYRLAVAEAWKQAASVNKERPDLYYRTLFKAYASIPEKLFPYDEVMPLWNLFLREDMGRSKFSRYRKLKFIARAPKEDKALEEEFFKNIQQRLLDFGFQLQDPTSTAGTPDVLLKLNLKGAIAEEQTNPKLQFKKIYRLTMDVNTLKFMSAGHTAEPTQVEIEEAGQTPEFSREAAIQKGGQRISDLLFYHCLRAMFPAGGAE